jgi:hypothetical protein
MATLSSLLQLFWIFGKQLPAIVSIISSIVTIIGSDAVQNILETIKTELVKEQPTPLPPVEQTETQRKGIVERLWRRIGLSKLGISETDYAAYNLSRYSDTALS